MICIALADLSFEECLHAVKTHNFVEIRIDLLSLTKAQITALCAANKNLLATCRPGKYPEDERKALLLHAIDAGAAYVDIEMETSDGFKDEVIKAARQKGCQIIISYHDFEKTPLHEELEHIVRWCSEFNPDIIKIACMVNSPRDNARLMGLLDTDQRMLVLGMGEKGKITRIISPLLGSFCTFAPYAADKLTGPGQLDSTAMETLIQTLTQL